MPKKQRIDDMTVPAIIDGKMVVGVVKQDTVLTVPGVCMPQEIEIDGVRYRPDTITVLEKVTKIRIIPVRPARWPETGVLILFASQLPTMV